MKVQLWIKVNALLILMNILFLIKKVPGGYSIDTFLTRLVSSPNVAASPVLPSVAVLPPGFVSLYSLITAVIFLWLFLKPESRLARLFACAVMAVASFVFYNFAGVDMATAYLIPFLLLTLIPRRWFSAAQMAPILVLCFSCMYLFSGLRKLNPNFLSGDGLLRFNSLLRLSYPDDFMFGPITQALGIGAVILQLTAGLMFFPRFRRWAALAAVTFHAGVTAMIVLSLALLLFGLSLWILILPEERAKRLARGLQTFAFFTMGGYAAFAAMEMAGLAPPPLGLDLFEIGLGAAAVGWIFVRFFPHLEITAHSGRQVWPGAAAPAAYLAAALALSWPEPLGYSQYATQARPRFGALIESAALAKINLSGRWDIFIYRDPGRDRTLAIFPDPVSRGKFLRFACGRDPLLSFRELASAPSFIPFLGGGIERFVEYFGGLRSGPLPCSSVEPP